MIFEGRGLDYGTTGMDNEGGWITGRPMVDNEGGNMINE